jgi:predicted nucleotide-binding protein
LQRSSRYPEAELIQREQPEFEDSDDAEAVREGIVPPVHVEVRALTSSVRDAGIRCQWLADRIESVAAHLEEHGSVVESRESNNRVFVGHLDSAAWRSLNGYLVDVLGLMPPWFDHVPPEGFGAAERLRRMVDGVAAAFLVVTLEDEHRGEDRLLRENVLHEIGLFQGRLGVNRAFILLEEGCEGFGSVSGVAQLVFPRGRIEAAFADVRRILERAEIL